MQQGEDPVSMSHWEEWKVIVKCSGSHSLSSSLIGCVTTQGLSFQTGEMGRTIMPESEALGEKQVRSRTARAQHRAWRAGGLHCVRGSGCMQRAQLSQSSCSRAQGRETKARILIVCPCYLSPWLLWVHSKLLAGAEGF